MKKNKTLFKTACILIILCGVGHTCYELFGPKDPVVFKSINNLAVSLPGGNEARLTSVLLGISVLMGTMLVGIGTINLSLTSLFNAKIPNKIIVTNIIISSIILLISINFRLIPPIFFIGLALIFFLITLFKNKKVIHEN